MRSLGETGHPTLGTERESMPRRHQTHQLRCSTVRLRQLLAPAASVALSGCLLDDPFYIRHDGEPVASDDTSKPVNPPPKGSGGHADASSSDPTEAKPSPASADAGSLPAPPATPEPAAEPAPEPTSEPVPEPTTCGNGKKDPGETCDGDDLALKDCTELTFQQFSSGRVRCTETCEIDTSECVPVPACGNGVLNANEECEGTQLEGRSCLTEGFSGGALSCDDECRIDPSECVEGPACDEEAAASSGVIYDGDTKGARNDWDNYSCSLGGRGNDVTISWTAESSGCFTVSTSGAGPRSVLLAVHTGCGLDDELACRESGARGGTTLDFEATANATYAIVVDGFGPLDDGRVEVHVEPCSTPDMR